ncbi:hypothetical protein GIB19_12525 [Pseudomonas sp. ITEM 17296]|uniref:hypothetical protein n=1 Tax=Pseudomonas sp. ITEM 17296 TaxID=2790281 RepID=UPI00237FFAA6|nr:hypothetical protein [Pseudomonas sp. ITEM 17296]MDE4538043.1 hypothetical protein [Pseudomonas sp. ITEM 17296]
MQTIDQRLATLESAVNTTSAAALNALAAVINAVTKLDNVDRKALWEDLESAKSVQVQGGHQGNYLEILAMLQSRIS